MIRVTRGPEPPELVAKRHERLPDLAAKVAAGQQLERDDVAGYETVRRQLWEAQFFKCAYCEFAEAYPYRPVEHFRPALRARRGEGFPTTGYWWLAWTWENLLFACPICNSSFKKDYFDLEAGSPVLEYPDPPPGAERPVLVDPALASDPDPMELVQFRPVAGRWIPSGRDGDRRGAAIVARLGLDAPAHLDRYSAHVDDPLMIHIRAVEGAIAGGDQPAIDREWAYLVAFARPRRPLSALSYDVIDHYFPQAIRNAWGLHLARP